MKNRKGFTLLELLVVIGIIAILVSFATVSYSSAQVRTRDSRRKSDLNAAKNALEQYYAGNNLSYPAANCNAVASPDSNGVTYMQSWPSDPGSYGAYSATCNGTTYCVCAQMETGSGGNASDAGCTWANNGAYYCIKNLQ